MLIEDNFSKSNLYNLNSYQKNLKKTKEAFNFLLKDIKDDDIPLLSSFSKDYEFNFSGSLIKKFLFYCNFKIRQYS